MSTPPLSVWCVSDGRAGIARQTEAVAAALQERVAIETRQVTLNPKGWQLPLPPTLWPMPLAALDTDARAQLAAPWPDVWIANGRRSVPYSLRVKSWSRGHSLVVQLQDPKVSPDLFDLVAPPRHDRLSGPNVITTWGAPVWYPKSQIEAACRARPMASAQAGAGLKAIVILGGPSKRHRFSLARAHDIITQLAVLAAQGTQFWMTSSRRTPPAIEALFRRFANQIGAPFFADEARDGPNPYLAWLAQADVALVSEDSTNMMTDAAFFGLPIHLIRLEGGDAKFDALHASFFDLGAARWFEGELGQWPYPPIRDASSIASAILHKLTNATL